MGAEVDLSSTAVAAYSAVSDVGGSFEFRDGNDKTGITVGGSRSNFGGLSRKNRVRYVFTPWKSVEFMVAIFYTCWTSTRAATPMTSICLLPEPG